MSSLVGTVVIGGFPPDKEAVVEVLAGQHSSSAIDPNFSFEHANPTYSASPSACRSHLPESF
jgi:hypothetical protein